MKRFLNRDLIVYLAYVLFVLVGIWFLAKLWVPAGFAVAGHDSGLALNVSDFFRSRFYAWSDQGFGQDNSPHFGSLITHGIDFVSALMNNVSYAGNPVLIFFWLSLIFISAFIFALNFKNEAGEMFPVVFPPLVTVNFFIIQSLFIFERAKYSVLIACIFMLLVLMKLSFGKLGIIKAVIFSSLTLFFFNSGSWLGLPLYGGFFVLIAVFLAFQFLISLKDKNFKIFSKIFVFLILSLIGFVLINAYSVFPYISTFISHDYSQLTNTAVIGQNEDWLRSLSQAGSFINFFRLQGIPDWYAGSDAANSGHSFATEYLKNPYLVAASFILPILAFSSFLFAKKKEEKRLVAFFGLLVLVSMFFMAGSHKPLGFIYEFFYTYIPGFSIFRSPYYKFGSAFIIGTSFLMAFSVSKLAGKVRGFGALLAVLFVFSWLGYHFVLFHPEKIFSWQPGLSTKVTVPGYIWDFKDWADHQSFDGRILLLPPVNPEWQNDAYAWGYWSLTNLPSVLNDAPFLNNDDLLTDGQNILVNSLYDDIRSGKEQKFYELADLLGVKYILLRNDVLADASWSAAELPADYLSHLENFQKISKDKEFGNWTVFKIKTSEAQEVRPARQLLSLSKDGFYLAPGYIASGDFVFDADVVTKPDLKKFVKEKAILFNCASCGIEKKSPNRSLPAVNILPDSKLYVFKDIRETASFKAAKTDAERISLDLGFSIRRAGETMAMLRDSHDEKYEVANLQKMDRYLSDLYDLLVKTSNPSRDYDLLQRVVDGLGPIESNFQNQVGRDDFGNRGEALRTQMQGVLWQIYRIKSFYSPILSDLDALRNHNVFYVSFEGPGQYKFQLITDSLPRSSDGSPIFPDSIKYKSQDKKENLKVSLEGGVGFFQLDLDKAESGQITLNFNNLPNLYKSGGISSQPFATGQQECIKGKITSFVNSSSYRIVLKISDTSQRFKFLVKSNESSFSSTNNFLHGDDEFSIDPVSFGNTFSYLYEPHGGKDPVFYFCGSGERVPKVDSIEVFEVASPTFILFNKSAEFTDFSTPGVRYSKVSPTEYKVNLSDHGKFVLVLNNTFNSQWRVKTKNGVLDESRHFMLNGYENAWLINENDGGSLVIEYFPQSLFRLGSWISAFSLLSAFAGFIVFRKKK